MHRTSAILIAMLVACCGSGGSAMAAPATAAPATTGAAESVPPPVVFDGFGLEEFSGGGSIASFLQEVAGSEDEPEPPLGVPMDVIVNGPSGRDRDADSLAAELKSRIEGFHLSAGVQADPAVVHEGPAKWVGGLGMSSDHDMGREVLELKTSLGRSQQTGIFGVEVGPRIERRLRDGLLFFFDGKAQAQARRSTESGNWQLPGGASDGSGMVGVAGSTGVMR